MRSLKLGLCAVLLLFLSLPLAAETSDCPTLIASEVRRVLDSTQVVSTDCYFRPFPTNAMRIYEHVQRNYKYVLVEYWQQCNGSITEVHHPMKGGDTTYCWRPTNTACVGNQDWVPSPLCN